MLQWPLYLIEVNKVCCCCCCCCNSPIPTSSTPAFHDIGFRKSPVSSTSVIQYSLQHSVFGLSNLDIACDVIVLSQNYPSCALFRVSVYTGRRRRSSETGLVVKSCALLDVDQKHPQHRISPLTAGRSDGQNAARPGKAI